VCHRGGWLDLGRRSWPQTVLGSPGPAVSGRAVMADPAGFYDDPATFAAYQQHRHSGVGSPNHVMEEPALLRHLGPVAGRRVADLGCGDASIGAHLLDAGCASYYGLDASPSMVAEARRRLAGRAAVVEQLGIDDFDVPADSFDLVVSRLALHYVADLEPVVRACRAGLSPGGRLVFTVVHPVITSHDGRADSGSARTSWLVDDYFSAGPRPRPWLGGAVTWHHRTVEDYVSTVLRAGLVVEAVSECAPERSRFEGDDDEFARRLRTPLFLLVAARTPRYGG